MAARVWLGAALITIVAAVALSAPLSAPLRIATLAIAVLCAVLIAAYYNPAPRVASPVGSPLPAHPAPETLDLESVLDSLPVAVAIIRSDGKIAAFNAAAGDLFGVDAQRAIGRSLIEIVRNFELDRRVTATLREAVEETTELAFSGAQERRIQVTTRILRGTGGLDSERRALLVASDATRVRELENLRREFVSNVSHELRTPLTAVKLMVETLQTGVERPASDEFLSSIAQETERMIALVEELLDLARLESGKLELRLGCVDVAELCRQAALAQKARSLAQGVELECSTPDVPIKISADRDKLYQVLMNLLDNALRHTPAAGRVTIAASSDNGSVSIAVTDSGSGIPSTALPHIFERFYVVDPARARGRSGTGLGLAIVKHIIEAHGGSVGAQSELGVGTEFRCVLPAGLQNEKPAL